MSYIELINHFWELDESWQFSCSDTRLYFYLVKTANRLAWVESFTHSDAKTCANVGISVNTFKTSRERLADARLIFFEVGGKGQGDKCRYQILTPKAKPKVKHKAQPNAEPNQEPNENYTLYNKINKTKLNQTPPTPITGELLLGLFDEFRKAYKGTTRSLATELADFKKKHDDWKEAIPLLMPALQHEVKHKEQLAASGSFVPSWKNLKTWLSNRCWEQEFHSEDLIGYNIPQTLKVSI